MHPPLFMRRVDWRRHWPLVGGVLALLLAALMLVPGMGEYSLWNDEVEVILAARNIHTLYDAYRVDAFASRMVHPPLIYVLFKDLDDPGRPDGYGPAGAVYPGRLAHRGAYLPDHGGFVAPACGRPGGCGHFRGHGLCALLYS